MYIYQDVIKIWFEISKEYDHNYTIFQHVAEAFALLGCYASYVGSFSKVSTQHTGLIFGMKQTWAFWPLTMRPIGCPETSANNNQHTIRKITEEQRPEAHN